MIDYLLGNYNRLFTVLTQHMQIVGLTLLYSIILASVITVLVMRSKLLSNLVITLLGAVYSIPSLALFAILIPFLGIGRNTAIVVLVAYNQFLLLKNFIAGFDSVDSTLIEAAIGMGMPYRLVLWKVKLPLAFPAIMAGIHLSVISTIGIATIAATINAGGIGVLLFEGLRTFNTTKILWGTIMAAGVAILMNLILKAIQRIVDRRFHAPKSKHSSDSY